jgi:hypothetical protein
MIRPEGGGRRRGLGPSQMVLLVAAAVVVLGCGGDTKTSVYLEVRNMAGATVPAKVRIDVYGPADGGEAFLSGEDYMVSMSSGNTLGSLVIFPGSNPGPLVVKAQGKNATNSVISMAMGTATIEADRQVNLTLTLTPLGGNTDGGTGGVGGATGGSGGTTGTGGGGGRVGTGGGPGGAHDAGADQPSKLQDGAPCTMDAQCANNHCVDGVCCNSACDGACYTCPDGACTAVPAGMDLRNKCEEMSPGTCMTDGTCDGLGSCRLYGTTTPCAGAVACSADKSSIVMTYACNGAGACVPASTTDCRGYLCASAACGTTCTADSACASSAFCTAASCVKKPSNLVGNGDLEYGTSTGWTVFPFGALTLSNAMSTGFARTGQYSAAVMGRSVFYQGPSYTLPTGAGRYAISMWAMQNQDPTFKGVLTVALSCRTGAQYFTVGPFGVTMTMGNWTNFTGTIDTSIADCSPTANPPGVVKDAIIYLNQDTAMPGMPVAFPDFYVDDLVVQVLDAHNLVGNPNFETMAPEGWAINGVGTLGISMMGGSYSLGLTGRSTSTTGHKYFLPLGPAKYNVVFNVLHTGTAPHNLVLVPTYTCLGGSVVTGSAFASVTSAAANAWVTLSGSLTMPPANASAGCRLTQAAVHVQQEAGTCGTGAGMIECPDLYLDNVSITLAP